MNGGLKVSGSDHVKFEKPAEYELFSLAQTSGSSSDNTSHAALRSLVWRFHAGFNSKSLSKLFLILIAC